MNKVEKIRAEVEMQIKEWRFYSSTEAKYRFETYTELLDYIDSLDDKCDGCNNVKGCVTCEDGSEWAHYEEPVSNNQAMGRPMVTDKELLDRAIDFIVWREEDNDYICEKLHETPEEFKLCAEDCQNLDHWCVLRFLMNYKMEEDGSEN